MNIKIRFLLDRISYNDARLPYLAILLVVFTFAMDLLGIDFHRARQSMLSSSKFNIKVTEC